MVINNIIFRPLFEFSSSTWTYLIADKHTKEAVIIDAVHETSERDIAIIDELQLKLKYIIETHIHADHVTSSYLLKSNYPEAQTVLGSGNDISCADIILQDGECLNIGKLQFKAICTPGHTPGCTCYLLDKMLFSGDTLLIRSCGRCDFQDGCAKTLYDSLQKLLLLDDAIAVFPAHDYQGRMMSTIGEERLYNKMIGGDADEKDFINRVNNMKLSLPKKIHIAVPSNKLCGRKIVTDENLL